MAIVGVKINGKEFHLACDDGQEQSLFELSQEFDTRVRQMAEQIGHAPESMLFLLAGLTAIDEIGELQRENKAIERENIELRREVRDLQGSAPSPMDTLPLFDEVAERIERIADRLEMS